MKHIERDGKSMKEYRLQPTEIQSDDHSGSAEVSCRDCIHRNHGHIMYAVCISMNTYVGIIVNARAYLHLVCPFILEYQNLACSYAR